MMSYKFQTEKKKNGWLVVGVAVFLGGLIWLGINSVPDKAYHCHKNGYLFESMNESKNIFTKTDIKCIRIDNIKEKK
tara:strand:- start:226 stop:456 length:231 start_codon:yes stop_codon:yes gene_type:complete